MRTVAVTVAALLVGTAAIAGEIEIHEDFESGFEGQNVVADQPFDTENGFKVYGWSRKQQKPGQDRPLTLFQSNCGPDFPGKTCTGEDPDLATGPSFGTEPEGLVLIISEDGDFSDPDDDTSGGYIVFDFNKTVKSLTLVGVLDTLDNKPPIFYLNNTKIAADFTLENPGNPNSPDNDLRTFHIDSGPFDGIDRLSIRLAGSGAITGVKYTIETTTVAEPAMIGLLGLGLVGLGVAARRRQR